MRAIVIENYGGPENLVLEELPNPKSAPGHVVIEVKAFGLNRAEIYFREGLWGDVARVSGIECVGRVKADEEGRFHAGQKVLALMGGMGRTINGSYAELTRVPATNVVTIETALAWEDLAAIPETYATAWACLTRNLKLAADQTLLVRGATSALGQAAVNIAAHIGAHVIATTRKPERVATLTALGASDARVDTPELLPAIREEHPKGIDAVLDIVGNRTILESLKMIRPDGRACLGGFLGGGDPIAGFDPLAHMPSGVHLSFFASAFTFGNADYPLTDIPFQEIVDCVANGTYKAKPARVFAFEDVADAHRLMESNKANGKIVIRL